MPSRAELSRGADGRPASRGACVSRARETRVSARTKRNVESVMCVSTVRDRVFCNDIFMRCY